MNDTYGVNHVAQEQVAATFAIVKGNVFNPKKNIFGNDQLQQ